MNKADVLRRMEKDLLLTGRIISPKTFYIDSPPVHYEIQDKVLDTGIKYLNIIAPRGLAKSSLVAENESLHHIFLEEINWEGIKDSNDFDIAKVAAPKFVIIVSKTQGNAINRLQAIKDILDYSMEFRAIFGYWGEHSARTWRNDMIELKNGSCIMAKGMGQAIRGIKHLYMRPSLIILDDPEDENNTKTSEAMDDNMRWLLQAAVPALDAHRGRLIVIGTPLHERCMVFTLKKLDNWTTLHYSYINTDADGNQYSLWPGMKTVEELLEEKKAYESIGKVSAWYKERQCEVIGDESRLFREDMLMYYRGNLMVEGENHFLQLEGVWGYNQKPIIWDEPKVVPVNVFTGIDPATSTSSSADYFAIVHTAIDANNDRYILPYVRRRMPPTEAIQTIINEYNKVRSNRVSIETVQAQETFRDILRNLEGVYIPGLAKKHNYREGKAGRYKDEIEGLEPFFYKHKVFLREDQQTLVDELLMFPQGSHDDLLDAIYLSFKGAYTPASNEKQEIKRIPLQQKLKQSKGWLTA
jgi:predicted phage terminase large subunit-like protein